MTAPDISDASVTKAGLARPAAITCAVKTFQNFTIIENL